MSRRNVLATLVFPFVSVLIFSAYLLLIRSRLPDEVAVHWGPSGQPDGFASPSTLPVFFAGLSLVLTIILAAIAREAVGSIAGRPLLGIPGAMVWFIGALVSTTASVQIDRSADVHLPGWTIPVAVLAGVAGWALAMRVAEPAAPVPASRAPAAAQARRADLPDGHTAVWAGQTPPAHVPLIIGGVVLVLGVALAAASSWWLVTVFVPVAGLVGSSSVYRVTIGRGLIDISGFVLGFPRLRVPLEQVDHVDVGTVDAWSFGGWGIRIGAGGETAVLTRSGSALVITRTDGAVLRVSLDEPDEAAAVLTSLLDRRS